MYLVWDNGKHRKVYNPSHIVGNYVSMMMIRKGRLHFSNVITNSTLFYVQVVTVPVVSDDTSITIMDLFVSVE